MKNYRNEPKFIIPNLIKKYQDCDNPLGDLAKDCIEDGAIGPYIKNGLEPENFFNYIADMCCDDCFNNALEPLRKEYNSIVGPTSCWRLRKVRDERRYYYTK